MTDPLQDHFKTFKAKLELNPSLAESISTRHSTIREYLKNNHVGFRDSKLIGSLQRKTRIHPGAGHKFDIDILVVLGEFQAWVSQGGISPNDAMSAVYSTVYGSDRYQEMDPTRDDPTITVTYEDDVEVQFVPAYLDMIGSDQTGKFLGPRGRGYWVAKEGLWQMADYDHEAEFILLQNKLSAEHLVPLIKMLKAIKRIHFPTLGSFPLEIIAAATIPPIVKDKRLGNKPLHHADLIRGFFQSAATFLSQPIAVPGTKSRPIVLANAVATELQNKFNQISRFIAGIEANNSKSAKVEAWRKLCGDQFPVTVSN